MSVARLLHDLERENGLRPGERRRSAQRPSGTTWLFCSSVLRPPRKSRRSRQAIGRKRRSGENLWHLALAHGVSERVSRGGGEIARGNRTGLHAGVLCGVAGPADTIAAGIMARRAVVMPLDVSPLNHGAEKAGTSSRLPVESS